MGKNILIVDDEENIQEVLRVNLKTKGYEIFSALNGKDALREIKKVKPDLIILDIMMPEIDGWEFCKIVRENHSFDNTKFHETAGYR
jgi:DNA-binding response OmpR family regulator